MRFVHTAIIAGVASAALAGAALAAHDKSKQMLIALPDGSVQHVHFGGDAAPQVVLVPASGPAAVFETAFGPDSPFAEMDRMAAEMEVHAQAMLREVATMQAAMPARGSQGIVMTNASGHPVGVMHYSYVSTTTGADGCTQTVRITSEGGTANEPKVIRTSAGSCGDGSAPAVAGQVKANAPLTLTGARDTSGTKAKIVPVDAARPANVPTPSRT